MMTTKCRPKFISTRIVVRIAGVLMIMLTLAGFPLKAGQVLAQSPNPWMIAFPEYEAVEAWEWPEGAVVTMTIDNAPGLTLTGVAAVTDWGDPRTYISYEFAGQYDLKVGDVVKLDDGTTQRYHTVQNLSITALDTEAEAIRGTADPGALVDVWPHGFDGVATVHATTDQDGNWTADFMGLSDLQAGMGGRSQIMDESGSATAVDWNIPLPPRIYAQYTDDHIRFEYAAPGAEVTFSIFDSDWGLLWEGSRTADDAGFAMVSIWEHPQELVPGMHIRVSDGVFAKELLLEPLSLEVFDPDENIMAGKAAPWREVWVVANNDPEACGVVVNADENGNWSVDFDDQGCDVYSAEGSYAQVSDEDGDTTEVFVDFIDGWHDYDQGDVPNWACNAGGWAVDTNDRERDLQIRILADGEGDENVVATTTASNDVGLIGVCGPDGTCGYEVNLWGAISAYEEHQIFVQAFDEETGQWLNLNDTPRPLTCRTYDIYVYDTLTGETRQLTDLRDSWEFNPRWSPDGKQIVHDRRSLDLNDNLGVHITRVDTGVSQPLTGAENGNYPTWSPNGLWIAFNQGTDLYLLPPAGGVPTLVRENAFMASWSPSSQRLVFNQPSDGSIRTTDIKGGNEILVATEGNGPAWSPNGLWIAYELDGNLWKVRVDIQGKPLGTPIQLTNEPGYEGRPSWSVDSQTIVFHKGFDRDTDLWVIPAAGGQPTWLTGAANFADYDPNYSNNGRYVAYSSFSPAGQGARHWAGIYTHDLPAGFWSTGDHTYFYRYNFEPGISEEITFNVSSQAELYDGLVLLRPRFQWARTGEECVSIDTIHPDQQTQFHFGWVTDDEMPYPEALAFFENLRPTAVWDGGMSTDLERQEILPFSQADWPQYVCAYTIP